MMPVVVAMLGAGCATPYQPMAFSGGVEETALGNSMYVVHASVNGYTSQGTAVQYAYRRAAELCPAGFDLSDKSESSTSSYWRTGYGVQQINKPEVTIVVRCRSGASGWWCAGGGRCEATPGLCEARRPPESGACAPSGAAICAPTGCFGSPVACSDAERAAGRDGSACQMRR